MYRLMTMGSSLNKASPLRIALIVAVLIGVCVAALQLVSVPVRQIYWGLYGRVRPLVSENNLAVLEEKLLGIPKSIPSPPLPKLSSHNIDTKGLRMAQNAILQKLIDEENEDLEIYQDEHEDYEDDFDWLTIDYDEAPYLNHHHHTNTSSTSTPPSKSSTLNNKETQVSPERQQHVDDDDYHYEQPSQLAIRHRLSKKVIMKAARKGRKQSGSRVGIIVITWANYHYLDFVQNWVYHVKKSGCKSYLVGAMDDELLQAMLDAGVPTFAMSSGLTKGDFGWGSPTFNKMGREKISLLQTFTHWNQPVIISDVDTVWIQNPLKFAKNYADAEILVSSDHLSPTTKDGGLEKWPDAMSAANIGIMFVRPSAVELVDEWMAMLDADENMWDQHAFNELYRNGVKATTRQDRLFLGYNSQIFMGILPVSTFCSGHTYFVQHLPEKLNMTPYVAHATFQYSGTPGKRHRFREALLWRDEPEYFRHDVGFLSGANIIPQLYINNAKNAANSSRGRLEDTTAHFDLVNLQLTSLRALFGLSTVLGRAVILPELWCGMDRWWAPHTGVIPGSELELPYKCPADHVLDLEAMKKEFPESSHGPPIEFRESSFLRNRKAVNLNVSTITVVTCLPGSTDPECGDGSAPIKPNRDYIIKFLCERTDEQIRTGLSLIKSDIQRIHFEDPAGLWDGFVDKENDDKFRRRMNEYGSLWCCVNKHPGHVWYDLFWDEQPHVDRHGRMIEGAWSPMTGP